MKKLFSALKDFEMQFAENVFEWQVHVYFARCWLQYMTCLIELKSNKPQDIS